MAWQGSMPSVAAPHTIDGSILSVHGKRNGAATSTTTTYGSSEDEKVAPVVDGGGNCQSAAGLLRHVLPMIGAECTTSGGGGRPTCGSPDPRGGPTGLFRAGFSMLCRWGSRTPRTGQNALRPPAAYAA